MSQYKYIVVAEGRHRYSGDDHDRKVIMDYVFDDEKAAEDYAKRVPSMVGPGFDGYVEALIVWKV